VKNKRGIGIAVLAVIFVVGLAMLLNMKTGDNSVYVYSPESEYEIKSTAASFNKNYASLKELYKEADLVAKVKVENHRFQEKEDLVYTISQLQLLKVYKGDSRIKSVQVYEMGGQVDTSKMNLPEKDFDQEKKNTASHIVESALEGSPTMRSGNQYLVFLKKYPGQDYYNIVGSVQGKIKMDKNNQFVGTVTEERIKKDELFFLQKNYSGKNIVQLEKEFDKMK